MKTTADYLDELRAHYDAPSDNALALKMGIHRQYMSQYRLKKTAFDDDTCLRVADILCTDPAYVVACMHAQRAKEPKIKQVWERIAEKMAAVAAVLAVVMMLPFAADFSSVPAPAFSAVSYLTLYIMSNRADTNLAFYSLACLMLSLFIIAALQFYKRPAK